MIKVFSRNILRFIFLLLLQVLVLDHINFGGFVNPYLFILFIILLPFETPNWLLLVIAFILGISIDIFNNSPGIQTAATLAMAYARPFLLKVISPRDGYEPGTFPRLYYYGFSWFFKYSVFMVLIHHFTYFI
ncbi:MAG: rod shape-determining protein MreD, partial [Marinilabiliales bacterium]